MARKQTTNRCITDLFALRGRQDEQGDTTCPQLVISCSSSLHVHSFNSTFQTHDYLLMCRAGAGCTHTVYSVRATLERCCSKAKKVGNHCCKSLSAQRDWLILRGHTFYVNVGRSTKKINSRLFLVALCNYIHMHLRIRFMPI